MNSKLTMLACILWLGMTAACKTTYNKNFMKAKEKPSYVVINDEAQPASTRKVLVTRAQPLKFPLSRRDRDIVDVLEHQFDSEDNCAGLAAPQIGFAKQIIVFSAEEDPHLKKWRKDFTQFMPKTIWINPSYEPLGEAMHEDFEGCFSVHDLAGKVKRYQRIKYTAQLPDGTKVTGIAEGFLARILQHEIDHVQGILFIDKATPGQLFSMTEYVKLRKKTMEEDN